MVRIPTYIDSLIPYKPGKSSDPADFQRYKAILSSNENNYGPSPMAMKAITESVNNIHLYPDPQGQQLCIKIAIRHGLEFENVILSNGLDGLLYSIFKAFTRPGDHVVTNDNSFVAFNKFAAMYDNRITKVGNVDYHFDLSGMIQSITDDTKIVYICNPNNPTGAGLTTQQLRAVLEKIPDHVLVIVDEAYFDYAKSIDDEFPNSSTFGYENVLTLRTFSKLYGLAGVRIGYGLGSPKIIDALKKVKLVFNPNMLAQAAAKAAMGDLKHIQKTLTNNTKWVGELSTTLNDMGIRTISSYANFICALFPSVEEATAFNSYMDTEGFLLRKLDGFGMPEAVRISIGTDEEMRLFSEVLSRF